MGGRAFRLGCLAAPLLPALGLILLHPLPEGLRAEREELRGGALMALAGCAATLSLIPNFTWFLVRRGITGKDLGKKGLPGAEKPLAEATGVLPATVFLVCVIFLQLFFGSSPSKMIEYQSAMLSICFMIFLGFADDVLDLPWRYKLFLPSIATLPLLCAYRGSTSIVIPPPIVRLLYDQPIQHEKLTTLGSLLARIVTIIPPNFVGAHALLDLGILYMVYMGLLAVFCTNAINIYAGINGLEAGQSFVIACAILALNIFELGNASLASGNHAFSAAILLPFIGVTIGLLRYNWYPARVFVGDTYCYFAGVTFAVVGIHGHFSKTLLLMFIPQVLNFLISLPQLFKIVPCPRHRLPRFRADAGLMEPSTVECPRLAKFAGGMLASGQSGNAINLTLINVVLHILGPMSEQTLCVYLLALQMACCAAGFAIRYGVPHYLYATGVPIVI